ncbi:MAG TPA: 50S ribosomal protein L30 [Anaerolinea thermolimosa]|jgi:large subunit ribosomal protein L30|uniref:Large ribosomal subunit protein uL30 n=1 Tax=Anaerolinea thermolimosa TaxID=229919 RepID=A0A3D1JGR0_9CHLR|nr:50S ribosomal protein L30 [Anaerolinea thermolimosa]GAP05795.1 LSU ribosomal protein L30P [Anaerolinea thermolimosa]HCE17644.1 50S ribosomal protein L30 [Anaerolinea thermolimosa]
MSETTEPKKLKVTLVKSAIGYSERHKATVRALGLRKLHQTVVLPDTPSIRGMLYKVNHLVKIEEEK